MRTVIPGKRRDSVLRESSDVPPSVHMFEDHLAIPSALSFFTVNNDLVLLRLLFSLGTSKSIHIY